MSIITVGVAVWLFGPILIVIGMVAWMEWYDNRQWRKDERTMKLWMGIEEAWMLPPHERHRS